MHPERDPRVYRSDMGASPVLAAEGVIEEIEDVLDQPIIKLRLIHRQVLSSLLW